MALPGSERPRDLVRRTWPGWAALVLLAWPCFGQEPVAVGVTIAPEAWLVERVGGERVAVAALVGPGESPATFLPSDRRVSGLMRAAVYFRIGVPCEQGPWLDAVRRSGRPEVVDLRRGVELLSVPRHGHGARPELEKRGDPQAGLDPHIWLSPSRLRLMAGTVAATLERLDPGAGAHYRGRLARFEERLDRLDAELRGKLGPVAGRAFMVFHPSWGYLAGEYGLRQLAIEIEGKEASDAELTELMSIARREQIEVIFVQPQIRGRAAETVARAIGGRLEVLDPLAADVAANLGRVAERLAAAMARTKPER